MVAISSYFARVGLRVDRGQIKQVDTYLKSIEKRLTDFQKRMAKNGKLNINFTFNTNRLQFDVQKAFNEVSRRVRFPVDNFVVNKQNLASQVSSAIRQAISQANKQVRLTPRMTPVKQTAGASATPKQTRSDSSFSRANFLHAGGAGGALARYGLASLPFVGGVYGLGSLNTANQNMMSANIAAESVLGEEAKARMDWLAQRTDYLGVNYIETLPQFTKFMASASPLLGGDSAQEVFSGFMQFGRTRGATDVSMNRALNAISQMGA